MIYCPFYAISWQKLLADQRRLKREQEEADIAARRHTGVIPTHHQFITNERFGDLLNIDDTAKRKSGSEVCFGCLRLLLDPKQCPRLPSARPSIGRVSSPDGICHPGFRRLASAPLWLVTDASPIMSCALYVQACLAVGPGSAGVSPTPCMPRASAAVLTPAPHILHCTVTLCCLCPPRSLAPQSVRVSSCPTSD